MPNTFVQINYAQTSSSDTAPVQHSEVIVSNGFSATGVADALCKRTEYETGIPCRFELDSQSRLAEMIVFGIRLHMDDEVLYIAGYGVRP